MTFPHAEILALRENTEIKLQAQLDQAAKRVTKLQRIRAARRAAELLKQEIQAMRLQCSEMSEDERLALQTELRERVRHRIIVYAFTSGGIQI